MKRHINYSIAFKINILLLMQVIYVLVVIAAGYLASNLEKDNAAVISTISRSKTNSQKIALLSELVINNKLTARDDLQEVVDKNQQLFNSLNKVKDPTVGATLASGTNYEPHIQVAVDSLTSLWQDYKEMATNMIQMPLYINQNVVTLVTDTTGFQYNIYETKAILNPLVEQSLQFIERTSDEMLYRSDYLIGLELAEISKRDKIFEYFKIFMLFISIFTTAWGVYWIRTNVLFRVFRLSGFLEKAARGNMELIPVLPIDDEVETAADSYNELIVKLNAVNRYILELGKGNFNTEIQAVDSNDPIWQSLDLLRINLLNSRNEEDKRKEEDFLRNWVNNGLAQIGDILRQNNENIVLLGDTILKFLINYVNAIQGGLFIYNPERNKDSLDLLTAFAYGKRKMLEKKIKLGQGLIGICALERNTIHIKNVPEDYFEISSGFGAAKPTSLLIVPLKMEGNLLGIIELAGFNEFKPHIIELVEKSAASIALTLQTAQNNIRTVKLLEQSQIQAEELSMREAEFKKIIFDMKTFQEKAEAREIELNSTLSAINNAMGMFEMNTKGQYITYNQQYAKAIGQEVSDLKFMYHKNYIDTNYTETPYLQIFNHLQKGVAFHQETKYLGKSNKPVYLLEYYTPIMNSNSELAKILVLTIDITKTKEQEQWLLQRTQEIEKQDEAMKLNFEEMMMAQQEMLEKEEMYKKQLSEAYEHIAELKRKKIE